MSFHRFNEKDVLQAILCFFVGIEITHAFIGALTLSLPFGVVAAYLPFYFTERNREKTRLELTLLWPEIIDNLISGLRSGLSLAETIIQLGNRGPTQSRPIFVECEKILRDQGAWTDVFFFIKEEFSDPLADHVCEVLDFARSSGSRELTSTLRALGDHIRSDISIRSEIRVKHGWIKNSAIIGTLAPWLLLLILSGQPSTIRAFTTGTGVFVLALGIVMSVIGFLWMGRVGRIEKTPRIFASKVRGDFSTPERSTPVSNFVKGEFPSGNKDNDKSALIMKRRDR